MQAPWIKAASMIMAASAVFAGLTGCKRPVEQADASVTQQLSTGTHDLPGAPEKAIPVFQKAAATPGASNSTKSQAQLDLGNAQVRAADHLILGLTPAAKGKQPTEGVEQIEARVVSICTDIQQMAAQIQASNVAIAGLKQLEPKTAQESLSKGTAALQGGQDKAPWIAADSGAIPSLAAVDGDVESLTQKITALQEKRKDLEKQRLNASQQAEQLRNQSEATDGHKSVDLFTQSSNLRKTAADLTTQMDRIDEELTRLNQDLQVAKAQKQQLDHAVKTLKDESAQVAASWKQVQEQIQNRLQSSQALLSGTGAAGGGASTEPAAADSKSATSPAGAEATTQPGVSIAALADQAAALSAQAASMRQKAVDALNEALKAYEQAGTADKTLTTTYTTQLSIANLRNSPQAAAWQMLVEIHNPSSTRLAEAGAWLRLARIYADWATTAAARSNSAKDVQKSVDAAKTLSEGTDVQLAVPPSLNVETLEKEFADAKAKADEAYDKAEKLLGEVVAAPATNPLTKSARDAARAAQMVATYGRSQFDAAVGDEANASKSLSESKRQREALVADNIALPTPMPLELSLAPAVSSAVEPLSTSKPTTAPTAAPAATLPGATTTPETPTTGPTTTFGDTTATKPVTTPETPPAPPAAQ